MTQYPESGVKLIVDTAEAQGALDDLLSSLNDIQGQDYSASVTIEADTSGVDEALADLPLDGETVDFTVAADVEVSGDELPVEGEVIDTQVDITETDTAKQTLSAVETIKNLKIIETVWNIAGTAVDIFGKFTSYAVQPMLDLDSAVARVNATTGNAVPNAEKLIKTIFYDDLGESIDQVAALVTQASNLKVPIDDAVRSALTFTHTFQDQNPKQVLDTMNQLVLTGLVPNFKTAGDVLVTAFQNGANKGEDLLTALNNNANAIRDMGLTGPQALSFIKTGLDNGFKSAQDVLSALEKIKQNVTNAAGNATSDVTKTLNLLGIANPAETGEAWSADFFKKVIEGIKNQPGLTDSEKEVLFTNLIGGKQGGKTFSAFLAMSPEDADTIFANMGGAADRAAQTVDDSLQGAIDDFKLAAEGAVQTWLSSAAVDLPGKIDLLKQGLQNALNVLAEGGDLGQALTIALKPIGFDDEFQGLESALGNFVIGILQAVAAIQDATGHGAEAAGTRATISQMGEQQLSFDLEIANPDDLAKNVAVAVSRGVTPDEITTTISSAVSKLVSEGSLQQAQELLSEFEKNAPNLQIAGGLNGEQISQATAALADGGQRLQDAMAAGIVVNVNPNLSPEAAAALQKQIDDATLTAKTEAANLVRDTKLAAADAADELTPSTDALKTSATEATPAVQTVSDTTKTQGTNAGAAAPKVQTVADNTKKLGDNATKAAPPTKSASDALAAITQNAPPAAASLYDVSTALQVIINKANAVSTAADQVAAAGSAQPTTTTDTGGTTPPPTGGGGGNPPQPTSLRGGVTAATLPYIQGASSTGSGGNNYAVYNTNLVQSAAQADRLGYSTAEQLRGMA